MYMYSKDTRVVYLHEEILCRVAFENIQACSLFALLHTINTEHIWPGLIESHNVTLKGFIHMYTLM